MLIKLKEKVMKVFFPRVEINNSNVLIDGRNFYDQLTNDSIEKYHKIRKITVGQQDHYKTRCCLDCYYHLIAIDPSRQRVLDVNSVWWQTHKYVLFSKNSKRFLSKIHKWHNTKK